MGPAGCAVIVGLVGRGGGVPRRTRPSIPPRATVFVASDAMLAVNRFVRPLPGARVLIMVTYHVGQALMAVGVLATPYFVAQLV